jgi:ABC-2 type transport system permease protein
MSSVGVLLQKDFRLFFSDKPSIILTFLVPFLLIYLFGNIFSGGNENGGMESRIPLAVMNESGTESSRRLLQALQEEDGLEIITGAHAGTDAEGNAIFEPFSRDSLRNGIVEHHYNFALILPKDLVKRDSVGLRLEFLSNPRNEIETQVVNGLLQKAVFSSVPRLLAPEADRLQQELMGDAKYDAFTRGLADLVNETMAEQGYQVSPDDMKLGKVIDRFTESLGVGDGSAVEGAEGGGFLEGLVEIEEDQVFGKDVSNPQLTRMIGGYAIMFLLFATTASATSLFQERENGLFLRLLSMPVSRADILWSKFLFNMVLGISQVLALFIASSFLFDIDIMGNLLSLLTVCVASASVCTAFGMLLSAISRTQAQAQALGTLLILGMTSLSGAWIPQEFMPEAMQIIGRAFPVYWCIEGFRGALWEQASVIALLPYLGVIIGFTVLLMGISLWRFRTGNLFH